MATVSKCSLRSRRKRRRGRGANSREKNGGLGPWTSSPAPRPQSFSRVLPPLPLPRLRRLWQLGFIENYSEDDYGSGCQKASHQQLASCLKGTLSPSITLRELIGSFTADSVSFPKFKESTKRINDNEYMKSS